MVNNEFRPDLPHSLNLEERHRLAVTGVSEVLSFDADFISVMTSLGKVEIEGADLRITEMSAESGMLHVLGRIDGVYYAAKPMGKKAFFSRKA